MIPHHTTLHRVTPHCTSLMPTSKAGKGVRLTHQTRPLQHLSPWHSLAQHSTALTHLHTHLPTHTHTHSTSHHITSYHITSHHIVIPTDDAGGSGMVCICRRGFGRQVVGGGVGCLALLLSLESLTFEHSLSLSHSCLVMLFYVLLVPNFYLLFLRVVFHLPFQVLLIFSGSIFWPFATWQFTL